MRYYKVSKGVEITFMTIRTYQNHWTNPSVLRILKTGNAIEDIRTRAKEVVFSAMQKGWGGPPFDPFALADILKIGVVASENVLDARILARGEENLVIEFNPNQPKARINYSIAHELAHTLFPDCAENVRERQKKPYTESGEWELEMLCNIGAAEFLMPIGSFPDLAGASLNIDTILNLRKEFEVSTESLLLRVVRLAEEAFAVFSCSKREKTGINSPYFLDYMVPSKSYLNSAPGGTRLPQPSIVSECTAIGFTAKGDETWTHNIGRVHIECVGLPPYTGYQCPRAVGLVLPHKHESSYVNKIRYLKGDATKARGSGKRVIAFIINDKGRSWGAGFAYTVQKKWPFVLDEFQHWVEHNRSEFTLGNIHISRVEPALTIFKMVAQHGYGESPTPRIRYGALEACLRKLAEEAMAQKASVHMPRIGCGQAGGSWWVISELLEDTLLKKGIEVTVYDLPKAGPKKMTRQLSFVES
jgi:O-acetyl-ADP-ribose deacetylase (regulator of RNase III)